MNIATRSIRHMSNLAAKYTAGGFHVVEPPVDFRALLSEPEKLRRSLEERRLEVNVDQVISTYNEWWNKYEAWKNASSEQASQLKKELRASADGLLAVLALPNLVGEVGKEERQMQKPTKHMEYLISKGLMRIDKDEEVVHLVGWPVILQQSIKNQLLDLFADNTLISSSAFARVAILEGINANPADYLAFTDNSSHFPDAYLVGCSLPALLTPFIRSEFSDKNTWPLTVQSTGAAYHVKKGRVNLAYACQRLKHSILSITPPDVDGRDLSNNALANIGSLLAEEFDLDIKIRKVLGKELKNYESSAIAFEEKGLELARISHIDDYISKRLNITTSKGFANMTYVETDIDRIIARLVDGLIDGREVPKTLRKILSS